MRGGRREKVLTMTEFPGPVTINSQVINSSAVTAKKLAVFEKKEKKGIRVISYKTFAY